MARIRKLTVFLDADVIFAGAAAPSEHGASHVVLRMGEITLIECLTSQQAVTEVERNLADKLPTKLPEFRLLVSRCLRVVPDPEVDDPSAFAVLEVIADLLRPGIDIVLNELPPSALFYAVDDELFDPNDSQSPTAIIELDLGSGEILRRFPAPERNLGYTWPSSRPQLSPWPKWEDELWCSRVREEPTVSA